MRLLLVLAIALAATPAAAHVAPALGDNNRYLKLTPLADRVRLAYTVFYGVVPGKAMRRAIDTNHDGTIDDAERQAFGVRIAREVAAAIDLTIDGARRPVGWTQVVVGLGTPDTAVGAFSVDLVAWICLVSPRGKHAVVLRDDFRLDRPGETEVKVEDSPGVTINATRIGGADDEANDYQLVGPSGALATDGLELQFTAGASAAVMADAVCRGPAQDRALLQGVPQGVPPGVIVGAAAVTAFVLAAGLALVMRRRRQRRGR